MSQTTPNLGLTVPSSGDVNWGSAMNANLFKIDAFALPQVNNVTFSSSLTVDLSQGSTVVLKLTGDVTSFAFINPQDGQKVILMVMQDNVGARAFAFPANARGYEAISTPNGNNAANSFAITSFVYIASLGNYYATAPQVYGAQ